MADEELTSAILRLLHERRRETPNDRVVSAESLARRLDEPDERVREQLRSLAAEDPPMVKESEALPDRWFIPG